MTQYNEKIINVETGEETIRPYTQEEIAEVERNIALSNERERVRQEEESKRQALFARLGITEDEAKLLLS